MKVKSNLVEDMMSAVREKDESQHRYYKKTKHAKFSEKANISYPPIDIRTCANREVRYVCFSENFVFCFLVPPVLRSANVPYYQRWLLSLARIDKMFTQIQPCQFRIAVFKDNFQQCSSTVLHEWKVWQEFHQGNKCHWVWFKKNVVTVVNWKTYKGHWSMCTIY